jgi:hypothetical protein
LLWTNCQPARTIASPIATPTPISNVFDFIYFQT